MTLVAVTRSLAVGAVVLGGIVAGFSVNRLLVELPAWVNLGPEQWASFTRHADLVVLPTRRLSCARVQRRSGGSRSFRSIRRISVPAAPSCWSRGPARVFRHSISNRSRGPNPAGRLTQSFEYPKRVCGSSIVVAAEGRVTHDYFRVQCLGFDDANVALKSLTACKSQPSQQ